jgi:hypothetical protein
MHTPSKNRYSPLLHPIAAIAIGIACGVALADHEKGNVDELRFGAAVDARGVVAAESHTDHFVPGTKIHVTMKVQEAVKDTNLLVSVLDRETEELVWSNAQRVPGGHANMHFVIPAGSLPAGKYRARVKLGDDWVAEHEFRVE